MVHIQQERRWTRSRIASSTSNSKYGLKSIKVKGLDFKNIFIWQDSQVSDKLLSNIWQASYTYTANVLALNSTFYFCVKNPLTVSCDFSRNLSVVYQDQYSALFT